MIEIGSNLSDALIAFAVVMGIIGYFWLITR
jgi:hypothetical protein